MQYCYKLFLSIALLLSTYSAAYAVDESAHKQHHAGNADTGMPMMGGMMMGAAMSEEKKLQHLRKMQVHMLKMHDLSNQILAEQDPEKKQALKDKQIQLMQEHMQKMIAKHKTMMQKAP